MRNSKKKMSKGSFGYLRNKRTKSLVKSCLFLAAVLAIYFIALWHFHTNKNVFSILAAVGALPTGRSIVETIMCFRAGSASEKARDAVARVKGLQPETSGFDLYLTSYERAFSLSHAAVGNGQLIGLCEQPETDCLLCGQHISRMLEKDGNADYKVRIYKNLDEYSEALERLVRKQEKGDSREYNSGSLPENKQDVGPENSPEDASVSGQKNETENGSGPETTLEEDRRAMALLYAISL